MIDDLRGIVSNVVVVDDGSTDLTREAVQASGHWLIAHPMNLGQGAALQTGIEFALAHGADTIVTIDADGQHRASDIPALVHTLVQSGADYALGSRFLGRADGIPWTRTLTLKAAIVFTRALSGVKVSDAHNGLRAMTRRGAERIHLRLNGMEHASEIQNQIVSSGLKFVEVPVHISYSAQTLAKGQRTSAAVRLALRLLLNKVSG